MNTSTVTTFTPRLVALDIDGTVVDREGVMPESVREAVSRVVEAGVPVVLVTGRSWHGTRHIADALGLPEGPHVCSNGAVTVHYPPVTVHETVTFDPSAVVRSAAQLNPEAAIAVEEVGVGYRLNRLFPEGDLTGEMVLSSIDDLASRPATRVIVRDPNGSASDFARMAEKLGMHPVSYFIGWSNWLDIAPPGVDKASALARVCRRAGVAREDVLALGDGRNDIELLTWAGRGVALGDAPAEVRAVADHVTGLFDEGGTAGELNRWFQPPYRYMPDVSVRPSG